MDSYAGSTTLPLDVGLVGAGNIGQMFHAPVIASIDEASLAYVADVDGDRAAALADFYDCEAVVVDDETDLPDSDVTALAIPVGVRAPYVDALAERGIAVFAEKPFAVNTEEHRSFLDRTRYVTCNYMRRYYSKTRQLEAIWASGGFGELERVELSAGGIAGATNRGPDHYQMDPALSGGGILIEVGCHLLSQLTQVFDGDIAVDEADIVVENGLDVAARARLTVSTGDGPVPVDVHVSLIESIPSRFALEFEDTTVSSTPAGGDNPLSITLSGDDRPSSSFTVDHDPEWATSARQGTALLWRDFLEYVVSGEPDPNGFRTEPRVTDVITQIYERGTDAVIRG